MTPLFVVALLGIAVFMIVKTQGLTGDGGTSSPSSSPGADGEPVTGEPDSNTGSITFEPGTWPTGDRIWDICRAIAHAEGADVYNSNPDRLNNPGDISDGALTYGGELHSGSEVTHFPDKTTGWQWLYKKIQNHVTGNSLMYPTGLTVLQFSQKYAANWQAWVNNVCSWLNIDQNSTFADYVNSGAGGSQGNTQPTGSDSSLTDPLNPATFDPSFGFTG